jgi:hypothetical protein
LKPKTFDSALSAAETMPVPDHARPSTPTIPVPARVDSTDRKFEPTIVPMPGTDAVSFEVRLPRSDGCEARTKPSTESPSSISGNSDRKP